MTKEISNSSHRSNTKPYFEWWYFHFVTKTGGAINIVIHETDIFGSSDEPYLSVSGYLPEIGHIRTKLPIEKIKAGGMFLHVNDLVIESWDHILFNINSKDLKFTGRLEKKVGQYYPESGVLYKNSENKTSNWLVNVPYGIFTGSLKIDDKKHNIDGFAYQDHQWGDLLLQEFVQDWFWGHFIIDGASSCYFKIFTASGELNYGFNLKNGVIHSIGNIKIPFVNIIRQNPMVKKEQSFVELDKKKIELTLESDHLMRSRINENHGSFEADYQRWSVENGVTEYLRIRPKL